MLVVDNWVIFKAMENVHLARVNPDMTHKINTAINVERLVMMFPMADAAIANEMVKASNRKKKLITWL